MANAEFNLHRQFANYVRAQYPHALFRSDLIALAKLPVHTASMMKQLNRARGWPDFVLFEPMHDFDGLVIEIKVSQADIFNKDMTIRAGKLLHVLEQAANIEMLHQRGFVGGFFFGYDQCVEAMDTYMDPSGGCPDENGWVLDKCRQYVKDNPLILVHDGLDPFVATHYARTLGL